MTDVSSATGSSLTESVPDKVVLVGDVGVGKTSIFLRFKTGNFQDTTPSHNPRDGEYQKEWQVAGSNVSSGKFMPADQLSHRDKAEHSKQWTVSTGERRSMTLYDTAGVERHTQTMQPTYFRRAKAVVLVYSIDNVESFGDIGSNWMDNSANSRTGATFALVGNKLDLAHPDKGKSKRAVSQERALQYAVLNDIDKSMVFEISAKTGEGVMEMFDAIAGEMTPVSVKESSQPAAAGDKPLKKDTCSNC